MPLLDRETLTSLLEELGSELAREGAHAKLSVAGGAAMVLAFESRDSTRDSTPIAYPSEEVLLAARAIAARRELHDDWLNDSFAAWLPDDPLAEWSVAGTYGNLEVFVASPEMLLALKLRASRGQRDRADIAFLFRWLGIRSEQAALDVFDRFFPDDVLPEMFRRNLCLLLARAGDTTPGTTVPRMQALNTLLWVDSPQGSVSHRVSRQREDHVLTVCGKLLRTEGIRAGRSPRRRICARCAARRP